MADETNFETENAAPSALDKFFMNAEKKGDEVIEIKGMDLLGSLPEAVQNLNGERVFVTAKNIDKPVRGRAYFMDWGSPAPGSLVVYTKDSRIINVPFEDVEKLYVREPAEKYREASTVGDGLAPFNRILTETFAEDLEKGGVYVEHYGVSDFGSGTAPERVRKLSGEKTLVFAKGEEGALRTLSGETYFEDGENPSLIIDESAADSFMVSLSDVTALYVERSETLAEASSVKMRKVPVISLKDAAAMMGVPYVNVTEETKNEDLLEWRATKINEEIPADVYEARMSRLSTRDREAAEEMFMRYPATKAEYFGYSVQESEAGKAVTLMMRIATCNQDAPTCERIFNASAIGSIQGNEAVGILARKCTGLVADFNKQIATMYDETDREMSPAPEK